MHLVRKTRAGRWLAAAALAAVGCGAADGDATGSASVRDSAGVTIVEHGGSPWEGPASWTVSTEPIVRIGVVDGAAEYMFDGVRAAVRLSDGRLVVADAGSNTIRWYDADGGFLLQRGGSGGGPGEFERLSRITLAAGDTIVALDWTARRITLFGPDGALGRMFTATATLPLGPVHRISDGSFIAGVSGFSTSQVGTTVEAGLFRYPVPLLRLWADERIDTVGMFPGTEIYIQQHAAGGFVFGAHTLGRELHYAVGGDRVYVGAAERFEVNIYEADGTWIRSIRAPDVNLVVTDATMDSVRSRQRALAEARGTVTPELERSLADMAVPETRPAHGALIVDGEQNLWVEEHRIDDRPARWAVFDPDGRSIGAVLLPERLRPLFIDGVILGRETDELGVESLVVYGIER